MLIIGESWAAKGRLLPYASDTLYNNLKKPVTVCTVGFSGRNAKKLFNEMDENYKSEYFKKLLQGNPDKVVLLTGVNDVVQHVGKNNYSNNLQKIINNFSPAQVYVMELPSVDVFANKGASLPSKAKRLTQWIIFDRMDENPIMSYRTYVKETITGAKIIPFSPFLSDFDSNKKAYAEDGIHLTTVQFNKYGSYIAQYISKN